MADVTLQKVQDEIALAMEEAINGSKLEDLLEEYGLKKVVKIQLEVNINQIKTSQKLKIDRQLKNALEESSTDNFVLMSMCGGLTLSGDCKWCTPCGACPSCL